MSLCIISCQSYAEMPVWTDSKHQISIGHIKYVYSLNDFDLILAAFQVRPNGFFLCGTVQKYLYTSSLGINIKPHYATWSTASQYIHAI